jgi:signal transduction histidine kinase/CheY-like chemotaxis protein
MSAARPQLLRTKLLRVVLLTTFVALAVALTAMVGYNLRVERDVWKNDLEAQAQLLGRTTAAALAFDDATSARESLALLHLRPQVRAAAVFSARGALFASYVAAPGEPPLPRLPEPEGTYIRDGDLIVFKRVIENNEILGTVYLRADYPLNERLLGYAGIAAVVMLLAMAVALALSVRLQRVVTRPILQISQVAREVVRQRDYSRRAQKLSDDEVGDLVQSFNDMMAEIEQRAQALEQSHREKEREVEERRMAQQEVMRLNADLELRVQERTAQLEASNRELALATETAQGANRAKSEFLSSMSHELRTPLNAIIGFGELLESGSIELSPEQKKEFTGYIVRAGHHLLTLINEVLNLAQIEAGKLSVSMEPVQLTELLEECRTMTEPLGARRGIRMLFPAQCELGVRADRTRLKQVLLNLLSNAVKYNRDNGAVVLDCTRTDGNKVRISVQDTGVGMRPQQLESLFQAFNRLGQEGGEVEGSGIGLVVTKQLVELMGGTLGVSSTLGTGSVFWVELEVCRPDRAAEQPAAAQAAQAEPPVHEKQDGEIATILCVDDNPASLKLVETILASRPGIRVLSAPDGRIGVELARAHRPEVILMDNNMPRMTGREAQSVLRDDPSTSDIPVIALTANAMPDAVAQGLAAGFYRYLTKPIEAPALLDAVDGALAEARTRRSR